MSEFRDQLQRVGQIHREQQYPGDLADDLLQMRRDRSYRWVVGTLIASAVAAAVAVAIYLQTPGTPVPKSIASNSNINRVVTVQSSPSTMAESIPYDSALVPPSMDLTPPSLPSIPSWEAIQEIKTTSTATTKESA